MTRDEIILSCVPIVENLVKKYNNHKSDEDLQSEGMIGVIEGVNWCLERNMTDLNQIQARCNVCARNKILTEIYREKVKYADDELALEMYPAEDDLGELLAYLEQGLTPRQYEIFELLYAGYTQEQIQEKLKITAPTYYKHTQNIKKFIKAKV